MAWALTGNIRNLNSPLALAEQATPGIAAASGFRNLFPRSDGRTSTRDAKGVELELTKRRCMVTELFTKANNTSSMGSTVEGRAWVPKSNTPGILNNQAYLASGTDGVAILPGIGADIDYKVAVAAIENNTPIYFRYKNSINYWVAQAATAFSTWNIYKVVNGSSTFMGNTGLTDTTNTAVVQIHTDGPIIEIFIGSVLGNMFIDTDLIGETGIGLGFPTTTTKFEEMYVWVPMKSASYQVFEANDNWYQPIGAQDVEVIVIAGGGGGASGKRGSTGSIRGGGGGGGGGGISRSRFKASDLSASEAIVVGTGGPGGAAVTANSTDGNNGTAGGNSSFSAGTAKAVVANGGSGGVKGTGSGNGAGGAGGAGGIPGTNGGAGDAVGGPGSLPAWDTAGPNGGGGGGGVTAANVSGAGAAGLGTRDAVNALPGSAGTIQGGDGGNGTDAPSNSPKPGSSGGGGAGGSGVGGQGGQGGKWGCGGGGGGGSTNGNNAKKGGDGGAGVVIVITR